MAKKSTIELNEARIYTPAEAAAVLRLGYKTTMGLIKSGRLAASRIGRVYRIAGSSIAEFVSDATWLNESDGKV